MLPVALTTPVTKEPVLATVETTVLATANVILPGLLTAAPTTINVPGLPATEHILSCWLTVLNHKSPTILGLGCELDAVAPPTFFQPVPE